MILICSCVNKYVASGLSLVQHWPGQVLTGLFGECPSQSGGWRVVLVSLVADISANWCVWRVVLVSLVADISANWCVWRVVLVGLVADI